MSMHGRSEYHTVCGGFAKGATRACDPARALICFILTRLVRVGYTFNMHRQIRERYCSARLYMRRNFKVEEYCVGCK
uniref:Uncharacterized protein n=1 Tax=Ascaris lumbricoides TaxID=6252 RepID=A0A0M3I1N3_ASCLU